MTKNRLLLLLALLVAVMTGAWAQSTSSLEFTDTYANGGATADDNVVWTVTSDGTESTFDNNKGIHYGTSKATVGYIELSTSGISGTITQVVVNASTASGVNATVGVTVGGNAFGGDAQSLTTSAENYTFTGSASGAIVVRVAKPSAATKALYVKSIEVTYTSGGGSGEEAQDAKHLITATYDKQTRSLEQPLPYATTVGALYEAVTGQPFSYLISQLSAYELNLTGITSLNTDVVSIGEFNGASTPVTVKADGEATVRLNFGNYAQGIFVSVTSPLYVTMKDGTQDAAKWTATVGTSTTANPLPVGGLSEKDAVTLNYSGRLKVKSLMAVSDAAPAPAGITAARAAYQGTNAPSQNWTKGDKLYVYGPGLELMGTLVADADGAEVLMAGTLDFTKTGTTAPMKLTLSTLPLPMDYRTQDGTQAKTTAYAMATATATAIDAEAGTVTLDATPTLAPQQALVKLSLQDANGQPLSPSTLSLDAVDPNGGYSTVTKLRLDLPIDQAPTWAYGNYTYNNGAITLTNNCGVGWNTVNFSEVMAQCTGVIAIFEEGATGAGAITLQYLKNGASDPSYTSNSFAQGQTWAWVGVPSDMKEIWGVFFTSGSDTTIKPTRISPNAIGDLTLSPNGSDVYVALKDVGTSNLTLRAKVGEKNYIYSGSVTFNEGNYYELTVLMTETEI